MQKLQRTKLKEDKTEVHFHCSDIVSFLFNAVYERKSNCRLIHNKRKCKVHSHTNDFVFYKLALHRDLVYS